VKVETYVCELLVSRVKYLKFHTVRRQLDKIVSIINIFNYNFLSFLMIGLKISL
jgi:hypothetical protein